MLIYELWVMDRGFDIVCIMPLQFPGGACSESGWRTPTCWMVVWPQTSPRSHPRENFARRAPSAIVERVPCRPSRRSGETVCPVRLCVQ